MIEDFKKIINSVEYLIYLHILKKYKDMDYEISEIDLITINRFISWNDFGHSKEYNDYLLSIIDTINDITVCDFEDNEDILYFFLRTTIGNKRYITYGNLYSNIEKYIKEEKIDKVLEKLMKDKVIIKASDWYDEGFIFLLNNPEFK